MLLIDRIAVVTGGAKGIGKGICLKFADEGCDVVVNAMHIEGAEKVADEIRSRGRRALAIAADVSDSSQVNAMMSRTLEEFGKIDILVNNAGGITAAGEGPIEEISEEDWDRIIDINLKGQFLCCKAVVPHMKENRYGKIVNVSSMGAIHPPAPIVHYHSAKGGVLSLTTNLAFELASHNITVNAILPGPVYTEFFVELLKDSSEEEKEAFFSKLTGNVPMHRMGIPEDIAGVALFLASDLSSYVTGESINAGGGLPLTPG
ncbi:MAG: SDR family oxidoreductase [Dehalococcoidales bacterium]|nr:SDR family oxidoreductase [Dehalococcoidales bacterium]